MRFHFLSQVSSSAGYCQGEHRYGFISNGKTTVARRFVFHLQFPNQPPRDSFTCNKYKLEIQTTRNSRHSKIRTIYLSLCV